MSSCSALGDPITVEGVDENSGISPSASGMGQHCARVLLIRQPRDHGDLDRRHNFSSLNAEGRKPQHAVAPFSPEL
jgi:hypothetical protein